VAVGVEDAHDQRRQPHEEQVGEHEAREAYGQLPRRGVGEEAGSHDPDDPWCAENAQEGQGAEEQQHDPGHRTQHAESVGPGSTRHVLGEHGDEGGRERTFRHEPAQEIRQAERDEEGVRSDSRAEGPRDHEVAKEAENPADQSGAAHDRGGARYRAPGSGRWWKWREPLGVGADRRVFAHRRREP
jgi:hypothetical protein